MTPKQKQVVAKSESLFVRDNTSRLLIFEASNPELGKRLKPNQPVMKEILI